MDTKISKWIKETRRNAGLTQQQLGDAIGRTKGNISQWEAGNHEPSFELLLKISNMFNVPLPIDIKNSPLAPPIDADTHVIKEFDAVGSMGTGVILRDTSGVIKEWKVDTEWVQKNLKGYSSTKNLYVVTGFGDSMFPLYNSGDPLIIDVSVKTVDFDAIYFFRIENEGFIKRLQRIPGEGLRAISDNKKYESWTIKPDMDFEVFGRIIKVFKSDDL